MNRETSFHSSDTLIVTDRSARRRWVIIGAVVVLALLALGIALMMGRGESKADSAAAGKGAGQIPTVTVVVPGQQPGRRGWSSPAARLAPSAISRSGSPDRAAASIRVTVDAGSWVRAGQVLAVVDRSVQAQQAAQLAAQVELARANAALAQANYERALALQGRGFVSKAEIDSKKATRDAAYAQVRVAQAQLDATRAQIGQLNVIAPASGLILARSVEVGQIVGPASGALFRLAEGGQMEMRAQLSQQDLAGRSCRDARAGDSGRVGPQLLAASVWQVAPTIDPTSRLGDVRIAVPYDPLIRPGGFAEARIAAGTTTAPLLPQSAVLSDDKGNYVYIVNARNEVERRNIKIGTVDDNGVTIVDGHFGQ